MKIPATLYNSVTADAGRILAATAIFYFHVGLFTQYPLSRYGEFAVEYFIMLSGLAYVLFSSQKPAGPAEYFDYVRKRIATLFPMFFVVNVILYLASFYYPSKLGRPYSLGEFLASATGVSLYLGWPYMSIVMWFMPFIVQVYLLLPLIDGWASRTSPLVVMLAAIGLSCLLAQLVPFCFQDEVTRRLVCKNWSPVFRLPEVCAGVILGRAALLPRGQWPAVLALGAFGLFSLLASLPAAAKAGLQVYLPAGGFLIPVLIFALSALIAPLLGRVNSRFMRLLGVSSFAFYLFQAAPMHAISLRFGNRVSVWVADYVVCWLLAVGLTLAVGRLKNMRFKG